jgi:hypothetical protein
MKYILFHENVAIGLIDGYRRARKNGLVVSGSFQCADRDAVRKLLSVHKHGGKIGIKSEDSTVRRKSLGIDRIDLDGNLSDEMLIKIFLKK